MKLFLAGQWPWRKSGLYDDYVKKYRPFVLDSFFYADADTERLMPAFGDFLLDSGAFTFMENSKTRVDWDNYIRQYAEYINRNGVKKYFELDIDSIVGYEKVLQYRKELERLTGRQCIPVWHISRGKDEFLRMCDEYPYVALGGIVGAMKGSSVYQKYHRSFPWFISEAHKRNAKIHGLGFTSLIGLEKYHFNSVDSTAWTTGNRFGYVYKFNGKTMEKVDVPAGKRIADNRTVALNNFIEWCKFQKYASTNL